MVIEEVNNVFSQLKAISIWNLCYQKMKKYWLHTIWYGLLVMIRVWSGRNRLAKIEECRRSTSVTTASGLQIAVRYANPRGSSSPTGIHICTQKITGGKYWRRHLENGTIHFDSVLQGIMMNSINLSNTNNLFTCGGKGLCTLDVIGKMIYFYGSNTTVTFQNIQFLNGYHRNKGGSLMIQDDSVVQMTNCSFLRNWASSGSAIFMNCMEVIVNGKQTSIVQNVGSGAPMEIYESHGELGQLTLTNNNAKQYVSIVVLF
jgi:hypothetical protein